MSKMITDYRNCDGTATKTPGKLEDLPDNGWYEYDEPVIHGFGGNIVRRFFQNDELGFSLTVEEVYPHNMFKRPYMRAEMVYINPKGQICFTVPDGQELQCSKGLEREDYVWFENGTDVEDQEFDSVLKEVFDGEDHSEKNYALEKLMGMKIPHLKKTHEVLCENYSVWDVCVVVQSLEGAFHFGEFFAKRAGLIENVKKVVNQ